jgi:hypothetical protein
MRCFAILGRVIDTPRLSLTPIDRATAQAVVANDRTGRAWHEQFPREDDRDGVNGWLRQEDPVFGTFIIVEPSQRVLEKTGFARTHETDEAIWFALDL